MLISPAYAQDAAGGAVGLITQLAPLLLIFGVFYFLLIRPQQKKQREHRALLASLKRGDRVLTAGGIIAKVVTVKEGVDEVEVEIAPNVRVSVLRQTIGDVLKPIGAADTPAAKG
ncbi:preprotein translocase subunit YajC [Belnapia rosea]|uniref:Sec translocon accessory complex subunit YajC n=1 Tax=Belnapia rosea TaxID=938405 RepID=A0A1G6L7C6_9PROT|nr:preprotein translocase subunit YajC [Belnapia rosea]SDC38655.1 protein translocase subunit yajC [Belnapia rosea]